MSNKSKWTQDWAAFVGAVGEELAKTTDNVLVTEKFAGKAVAWTGKVAGKRQAISRPGIQMEMPAVVVKLPDGRSAKVDFLFLTLSAIELPLWQDVKIGETLRFATQIRRSSGPFPGIRWSPSDDVRGLLLFLTDGGLPLEQVGL